MLGSDPDIALFIDEQGIVAALRTAGGAGMQDDACQQDQGQGQTF
jgi:hypothetical protein